MNKKLIIILVSITVIGVLFLLYMQSLKKTAQVQPPPPPTPKVKAFTIPTGDYMQVSGLNIKNFYKTAIKKNTDGYARIAETPKYVFIYTPNPDYFLISIKASPFPQVRTEAEQAFIKTLGVSQNDACKLYAVVATTNRANKDYAGKVYRLSFCK